MAVSTKIIKGRIRSIGNTKKITKAMEMVSAAKMRRSVNAVLATRDYAESAFGLAKKLAKMENNNHELLTANDSNKTAIVLITSNRGLCGSFNEKIIGRALKAAEQEEKAGREVSWIVIGSKGSKKISRLGLDMTAEFDKPDIASEIESILPAAQFVRDSFIEGEFGKVILAYTDYKTILIQNAKLKQILPITLEEDQDLGFAGSNEEESEDGEKLEFEFEPSKSQVLNYILPRVVEIEIYQALLESNASEFSARMMAMKNASEAAGDMISDLTLIFNRARQAYITQEIAEISGGKAALESK